MTVLDTRRDRARKQEPITTLGDSPEFQKILESRRLKSHTDSPTEQPETHAAAIDAERPRFPPIPDGLVIEQEFKNGIRVLRNEDATAVAVQFADNRIPSRAEKDTLEALGQPEHLKFTYQPGDKIWVREDYQHIVENVRDAVGLAGKMDEGRGRGR